MRRQCLEGLALVRRMPPERKTGEWQPGIKRLSHEGKPGFIYSFQSVDQLSGPILSSKPDMIWLPLREIAAHLPMIQALREKGLRFASVLRDADVLLITQTYDDRKERHAAEFALEKAALEVIRPGDTVLLCGMRDVTLNTTARRLFGFTDGIISDVW
jgi:hypothetical protein